MSNKKQSGLDIDLGNACSKDAYNWAKSTFSNRTGKAGAAAQRVDGAFSNMILFGNERIGITSDGIGTKIELAERTKIYNTLGYDLVAMVADDLATAGFEPTNISNIIDVDSLDQYVINELMKGLAEACNYTGLSISGGEIAELGNRIGGYGDGMHFNWCSTSIGHLSSKLDAPIDGSEVKDGQVIIALQSRGFRSNGFSLLRRVMQSKFGDDWHNTTYDGMQTWGQVLLTPSLIYAPLIVALIESDNAPKGIAHITGGGIADNFSRVLKANQLGAIFDNLFEPLPVMKRVQELGEIKDEDAYLYWNMGNGMMLVVEPDQVEAVLAQADKLSYKAQVAGKIIGERKVTLKIENQSLEYNL